MPTATTFDALKAARDLEAAGVERRQADALGEALRRAAAANRGERATKRDIAAVKGEIASVGGKVDALRYESRFVSGVLLAFLLAISARLFGLI